MAEAKRKRTTTVGEHIARLERREAYLREKIAKQPIDSVSSYDRAEAASIRFAINRIEKYFKFSIDAALMIRDVIWQSQSLPPDDVIERLVRGYHFSYDWNPTDAEQE